MSSVSSEIKRISVVLCTHNGSRYIAQQLESILHQTRSVQEFIIQDDSSDDGTVEILESYAQRYPVIKLYLNKMDKGINENHISALSRATGDYVAISYQSDIWDRNKLMEQIKAIGDYWLCFHPMISFDRGIPQTLQYDSRTPNFGLKRLIMADMICGGTMLMKKELIECTFKIPKDIISQVIKQFNYDSILSIVAAAYNKITYFDKPLLYHRVVNVNIITDSYSHPCRFEHNIVSYLSNLKFEMVAFNRERSSVIRRIKVAQILMRQFSGSASCAEADRFMNIYLGHSYVHKARICLRNRKELFYYPDSRIFSSRIRALLYPLTCCEFRDMYSHISER